MTDIFKALDDISRYEPYSIEWQESLYKHWPLIRASLEPNTQTSITTTKGD